MQLFDTRISAMLMDFVSQLKAQGVSKQVWDLGPASTAKYGRCTSHWQSKTNHFIVGW